MTLRAHWLPSKLQEVGRLSSIRVVWALLKQRLCLTWSLGVVPERNQLVALVAALFTVG